jgi:hypothetical protein
MKHEKEGAAQASSPFLDFASNVTLYSGNKAPTLFYFPRKYGVLADA